MKKGSKLEARLHKRRGQDLYVLVDPQILKWRRANKRRKAAQEASPEAQALTLEAALKSFK